MSGNDELLRNKGSRGIARFNPDFSGRISKVFTTVIVFERDFPLPTGIFF
jgi:hypothetical protein